MKLEAYETDGTVYLCSFPGKQDLIATLPDFLEDRHKLAGEIAAAVTACHGLPIPPDVPPGALAALVAAARAMLDAQIDGGMDTSDKIADFRAALAPFTADPGPPVSPPERKPYGYAVKANTKGYLAIQGNQAWFESEPVGWAIFGTEDHARVMLEGNHSMIGTAPHEGGEVVPVYRD